MESSIRRKTGNEVYTKIHNNHVPERVYDQKAALITIWNCAMCHEFRQIIKYVKPKGMHFNILFLLMSLSVIRAANIEFIYPSVINR